MGRRVVGIIINHSQRFILCMANRPARRFAPTPLGADSWRGRALNVVARASKQKEGRWR